jgi:hypothetical protein
VCNAHNSAKRSMAVGQAVSGQGGGFVLGKAKRPAGELRALRILVTMVSCQAGVTKGQRYRSAGLITFSLFCHGCSIRVAFPCLSN